MILVIALLCSVSGPCRQDTAIDYIRLGEADNAIACMIGAQQTLAQLAIRADANHRWKVLCVAPTSIGKADVG